MKNIPIRLGVMRASGAARPASGTGASLAIPAEIRQKIYERDNHTCSCCGFRSEKYQDVLYLNQSAADTRLENLATVCIFCHQCFYLDQVTAMRSAVLIWLPEIDQASLHHIARAVYVARISQGPVADAARRTLDVLMQRRDEVKKRLGTDDPFILSTVLRDYLGDHHYAQRESKLAGVKLLPLDRRIIKEADLEFNQFPQILAYWRSKDGPFGGKMPQKWVDIYKNLSRKAA